MRSLNEAWLLCLIPAWTVLLAVMARLAAGPFWLGTNSDPSYLYLFNGSYILDGIAPMFTDHPGTTLQLLIAGVLSAFGPFASESALVAVTAYCAEWLLALSWGVLLLLFFLSSWGLGQTLRRVTGSLSAALAVQVMGLQFLLVQEAFMPHLANVNAEALLIPLMNVYFALLLLADRERSFGLRKPFLLGVVAGACLVTKMTFLPFLVLPFLFLGSWRRAAVYIVGLLLSLAGFTAPIWPRFSKWWGWTTDLLFKTGPHGSGSDGVLVFSEWLRSLTGIVVNDWPVFLLAAVGLTLSFRGGVRWRWCRILAWMVVVQAVFVAKQGHLHYMVPAAVALGVLAAFLMLRVSERFIRRGLLVGGLVILSLLALVFQVKLRDIRDDQLAFHGRIRREVGNGLLVGAYRASSPEFAIYFGHCIHYYKGPTVIAYFRPYGPVLTRIYPPVYQLNYWAPWFASFAGPEPLDLLLRKHPRIFVHTTYSEVELLRNGFKKVDECITGEKLYELH